MHEEKGEGGVWVWFPGGCAQWSGKLSMGSRFQWEEHYSVGFVPSPVEMWKDGHVSCCGLELCQAIRTTDEGNGGYWQDMIDRVDLHSNRGTDK